MQQQLPNALRTWFMKLCHFWMKIQENINKIQCHCDKSVANPKNKQNPGLVSKKELYLVRTFKHLYEFFQFAEKLR